MQPSRISLCRQRRNKIHSEERRHIRAAMREFEGPHYGGGGGGGGGGGNMKYDSGRYHLTTASNHSSGNRPGRWAGLLVFQDSQGSARVALQVLLWKLHLQ